jgi:ABC-type multidrug transport system fused ATPase/permease subunit
MVSSLINIKIAIDRFIYLKNKRLTMHVLAKNSDRYSKNIIGYILAFIAFSAIYNIPNLIIFKIVKNGNETSLEETNVTEYKIEIIDSLKKNEGIKAFFQSLQCIFTVTILLIMIVISTLTYKIINKNYKDYLEDSNELRKQMRLSIKRKTDAESNNNSSNNHSTNDAEEVEELEEESKVSHKLKRIGEKTSMLVLWVSVLFIMNELVAAMGYIMFLTNLHKRYYNIIYFSFGIAILAMYVTTCNLNMFLYKKYNKTFAIKFKKIIFCKKWFYRVK